jgi:hypothetical protein
MGRQGAAMMIGSASKECSLQKEVFPLKVPYVVREAWGFIALCIILFFPFVGVLFIVLTRVNALISAHIGRPWEMHPAIGLVLVSLAFLICFVGPWWLVGSRTSRFILQNIRHHLDQGRPDLAEKAALLVDYQIWFRDFQDNEWFRQLLQERNLYDKSARYKKLLNKLE